MEGEIIMTLKTKPIHIRPYQIMCVICRFGSGNKGKEEYYHEKQLDLIVKKVQENPYVPLQLFCNVKSIYSYQNPGTEYDTPEGDLFNKKRDLDILQKLGLVPGDMRPAYEMFFRVYNNIPSSLDICSYRDETSTVWNGCRLAKTGNYEEGISMGIKAIFPERSACSMKEAKQISVKEIYEATLLRIRPHHLMCMACFHAGQSKLEPIEEDNLFEAIDVIRKNPLIPVELIAGPCMICPPCECYRPAHNLCVSGSGMGLRDEKKDLDVLQILGLKYGDIRPAKELYQLLFSRVPSTTMVCGYRDGVLRAPEWRVCRGPSGSEQYVKARKANLGIPDLEKS